MKIFITILLLTFGVNLHSQIIDSTLIDNNIKLNKYESDFLNDYLKEQRDTFDFSQKRIAFITGSSGSIIGNKKDYFKDINKWDKDYNSKIVTSLVIFNDNEKELSGGYDAILTYWVKLLTDKRKQKIIGQIKICR
ncbi:MAG: hypothetical protein JW702_07120 [Clostridiales bacterium]|nr:hypothetical protein [Clostridiales bacterium]